MMANLYSSLIGKTKKCLVIFLGQPDIDNTYLCVENDHIIQTEGMNRC